MKIKNRLYLLGGTAAVSLAAIVLLLALGAKAPSVPAPSDPASLYTIGEWNGRLAVFFGEEEDPTQVYDVYIAALPEEEQVRLKKGVNVEGEEQLQLLLEDYTS